MPQRAKAAIPSLNSWKQIAAFMDRGVRTVQRWEKDLNLPVHRVGDGPRSPVYAFPSELTAWLYKEQARDSNNHYGTLPNVGENGSAMRSSVIARVLVHRSSGLVHQLLGSLSEQRRRTEELNAALNRMRKRLQKLRGNSKK